VGAKVNGKIVSIDHVLETGDILEIRTSKQSYGPSIDWLKMVKTSSARNKIRSFFKKEDRAVNIEKGRQSVELEIKNRGYNPDDVIQDDNVANMLARYKLQEEHDLYAMIGFGGVTANQVTIRLLEKTKEKEAETQANQRQDIARTHH